MAKPSLILFTRIGFAARGLTYLLIAFLAVRVGRSEDAGGALAYLKGNTGELVLGVMAVGFVGYGAWRLLDASLDLHGRGTEAKGIAIRMAGAVSGLIHLGLAFSAAKLAFSDGDGEGATAKDQAEGAAASAMELPLGEGLLFAVALLLAAAGAMQISVAVRRRFREHLSPAVREARWVNIVGALGYGARGIVFFVAAWLLFRAAIDHSPSQAGAVGDALASLPTSVGVLVALGLGLFGVYSLIEARYRMLPDPHMKDRLAGALS